MIRIGFVLLLSLFFSCNTRVDKDSFVESDVKIDKFNLNDFLLLDHETAVVGTLNYPIILNNKFKILTYSKLVNALKIFDLETRVLEKTVKFQTQGPNALQGIETSSGINFVNQDSIIFFSQGYKRIYLGNLKGEIYKSIEVSKFQMGLGSIGLFSPLAYRDGFVYLQFMPLSGSQNLNSKNGIVRIDLDLEVVEILDFKFPEVYDVNYSQQLEMIDIVYNKKIDKFIVSLPLSDSVYVTDFKGDSKKVIFASDLVKSFKPFDIEDNTVPKEQRISFFQWISDAYGRIFYDPINDFYIREARKGITEQEFIERSLKPKKELIIMNSDFKIIKKIEHDGSGIYYYYFKKNSFFVNKDLRRFNLDVGNEDSLFFQGISY